MARSSMRRVLLLAAALAIVNAPSHARSRVALPLLDRFGGSHDDGQRAPIRAEPEMDARLARVEYWLKAVMRHKPGTPDEAAVEVSQWSNAALRTLWVDTRVIVMLIRNPKAAVFAFKAEGQPRAQEVHYASVHLHRLRVLACAAGGDIGASTAPEERHCREENAIGELDGELRDLAQRAHDSKRRGDHNYILRRGALLESDIGMFVPTGSEPINLSSAPGPDRFRMNLADGQGTEFRQVGVHWELARMLLDYIKPNGSDQVAPGRDEMVRDWYRATAAWMQDRGDYDTHHIERAREVLSADPIILFLSGSLAETYAAPHIQSAIRSAVAPAGTIFAVAPDRAELRQADGFYRRALAADSSLPELHLRFGHVLLLLGHEADAVRELRLALDVEGDPLLRYYGELFLGAAEERLGHADAARQAYADASALYPNAQSPHLALSALARRHGDRAIAFKEMQIVFELQHADEGPDDPWWTYYNSQARNADGLLDALWRPFLSEAKR
jgi:tetratricopeptide (TPR) repeat protein